MRLTASLRKIAIAAATVGLLCGAASADIRAFNDAMQMKDYKKAAAEAVSTWATLDKSRADLPIIANEFGFASLMGLDYESARTFATAALAGNGDKEFRIGAEVLLRFAEFKLTPSGATRDKLLAALEASATLPGIDVVSFLAVNALTTYDVESDSWRAAQVSAALGENLTGRGKGKPSVENLTFGLIRASSRYVVNRNMEAYNDLVALHDKVVAAIEGAATDEEATKFEPLYWQVSAWEGSAEAQLRSNQDFRKFKAAERSATSWGIRAARLKLQPRPPGSCKLGRPALERPIAYPSDALDDRVAGVVIVTVDVDASGAASNPRILAAVPQRYFGDAVVNATDKLRFARAADDAPDCTLAQKDKVFTYVFEIRH